MKQKWRCFIKAIHRFSIIHTPLISTRVSGKQKKKIIFSPVKTEKKNGVMKTYQCYLVSIHYFSKGRPQMTW